MNNADIRHEMQEARIGIDINVNGQSAIGIWSRLLLWSHFSFLASSELSLRGMLTVFKRLLKIHVCFFWQLNILEYGKDIKLLIFYSVDGQNAKSALVPKISPLLHSLAALDDLKGVDIKALYFYGTEIGKEDTIGLFKKDIVSVISDMKKPTKSTLKRS